MTAAAAVAIANLSIKELNQLQFGTLKTIPILIELAQTSESNLLLRSCFEALASLCYRCHGNKNRAIDSGFIKALVCTLQRSETDSQTIIAVSRAFTTVVVSDRIKHLVFQEGKTTLSSRVI